MRTPHIPKSVFTDRQKRLAGLIPNSAVILPAHPEFIRNNDVHHPYRQDSNLFYLTGFEEPESVLVFRPGKSPESVLFTRLKDPERETWDGFRYGPEGAVRHFAVEAAYPIQEFESITSELLLDVDQIYYSLFQNREFDEVVERLLLSVKAKRRRSGRGVLPIHDSYPLLGELRIRKSEHEATTLKKACQVTAEAHVEVMRYVKPGLNERAVQGKFVFEIMQRGAAREGYGTIVAGGSSATTLHYVFNDQELKAGDLLLIDAGGEVDYFTGDITRTYPVNGTFSPTQARLYEQVLDLQKHLIAMVKPGVPFADFQNVTIDGIIDICVAEKLLAGSRSEIKESGAYRKYYPHGVSHFLGMDVHDAGTVEVRGTPRLIESGMAFTIEPGIYIPQDDQSAPEALRGIGIRIEDNVLVTREGHINMTEAAIKETQELQKVIGSAHR